MQATYAYDIEGKPTKAVYPLYPNSGEYRFGYDSMSRLYSISKWQSSQLLPVISQIQYGVAEQVTSISYGGTYAGFNGATATQTRSYNERLELTRMTTAGTFGTAMDLEYVYPATGDNGQILQMKNWQSQERVQYEYDSLKRLKKAWTTEAQAGFGTWGVNYSYDGFGNLEQQTPVAGMQNAPPSLYVTMTPASRAKNQMAGGASYDGNGNLTNSAQHGSLEYDVDNRLERVVASAERYGYGGGNLRRWRTKAGQAAANSEIYFYGLNGELVATFKVTGCTTAYGCGGQP